MKEKTIPWNDMLHPDEEALKKRDAFLSDENGKRLQKKVDESHLLCARIQEIDNELEQLWRDYNDRRVELLSEQEQLQLAISNRSVLTGE